MAKLDPTLQKMLDDIMMERTEMILDFDRNLIVGLIAAIPAGNLLAHMPIPATMTTMTELLDARKLLDAPPPPPPTASPFVPTAMAANDDIQRVCLNCHSKDHIIFKCPGDCKLTNCPRNADPSRPKHKARFCDLVTDRERFATLLKASPHCFILPNDDHPSNCVSSPPLSSFSSTSSDWGVSQPLIQIDCGSNVLASPISPFNLPERSPIATESIDVAD